MQWSVTSCSSKSEADTDIHLCMAEGRELHSKHACMPVHTCILCNSLRSATCEISSSHAFKTALKSHLYEIQLTLNSLQYNWLQILSSFFSASSSLSPQHFAFLPCSQICVFVCTQVRLWMCKCVCNCKHVCVCVCVCARNTVLLSQDVTFVVYIFCMFDVTL